MPCASCSFTVGSAELATCHILQTPLLQRMPWWWRQQPTRRAAVSGRTVLACLDRVSPWVCSSSFRLQSATKQALRCERSSLRPDCSPASPEALGLQLFDGAPAARAPTGSPDICRKQSLSRPSPLPPCSPGSAQILPSPAACAAARGQSGGLTRYAERGREPWRPSRPPGVSWRSSSGWCLSRRSSWRITWRISTRSLSRQRCCLRSAQPQHSAQPPSSLQSGKGCALGCSVPLCTEAPKRVAVQFAGASGRVTIRFGSTVSAHTGDTPWLVPAGWR